MAALFLSRVLLCSPLSTPSLTRRSPPPRRLIGVARAGGAGTDPPPALRPPAQSGESGGGGGEKEGGDRGGEGTAMGALCPGLWFGGKQLRRLRVFFASGRVRSVMLLNLLTVVYASDIPVLKEVEAITEPAFFNMVRFSVSAIPFLPFALKALGDYRTRSAGLELGLWISLGYLSQAVGLITSEAGRASFISAFTVIIVPLIDGILGASIPALIWFGAILSLFGIGLLECDGSPPGAGDVLNLLSASFFGIHTLRTEQISRSTKKEKFLALLSFQVCIVAFSSILWYMVRDILVDVTDLSSDFRTASMPWDALVSFPWLSALYTGLFSMVLCLWAEMHAMGDVSATETSIIYSLEPLWGAAFAWFYLDERWGTTGWIGAALILGGSLAVQLFGSTTSEVSRKVKRHSSANPKPTRKQDTLSFSAVVLDSEKDIARQLKRLKK